MDNDFQIQIGAIVSSASLNSIVTQIQSHLDKNPFKIRVQSSVEGVSSLGISQSVNETAVAQQTKIQEAIEKTILRRKEENDLLEKRQSEAINKALEEEYQNRIKLAEAQQKAIKKREAEDTAAAGRQAQRLIQSEQNYKNLNQQLENSYEKGKLTTEQFTRLTKQVEVAHNDFLKLSNATDATAKNETKLVAASREEKNAMADTRREMSGLTAQYEAHSQDIDKIVMKYVKWIAIATMVSLVSRSLKQVVQNVKALDAALVELNKVADVSSSELNDIKERAFDIADATGKVGTEVLGAITEFKRAGYTIEESMNLAETALIMTNVAEGITDAGTAAEYLVSILKGAKLPISEATHLLDALNEISNTQAVSFDALADMVQRVSGTMTMLGNSIDETMALVTGAYEVLQDERVAKGLSVISLRIAGLNEDLEREAGLQSTVNKALEKYAGISVFDSTMQLRSTFDILQDLAGVWDGLNKNVQTYLTTTIAGKNRADVLAAALSNWESVESSLNSALDSTGSALQEQERYLNSIEGKQEALSNAWQKLADDTLSSDFVKRIYSFMTAIVNLIDKMGGLIPLITTLVGLLTVFNAEKIAKVFVSIGNNIATMKTGAAATIAAMKAAGTEVDALTVKTIKLQAALGWIGLIVTAISAIASIVSGITNAINENIKKQEEARKAAIDAAENSANKLIALREEYTKLSSKEVKTAEDEKRLLEIQKSLALSFSDLSQYIDDASMSYNDWLKLIDKKTIQAWQDQLNAMSKDIDEANQYFDALSQRTGGGTFSEVSAIMDTRTFLGIRYEGYAKAEAMVKKASKETLSAMLSEAKAIKEIRDLSEDEQETYNLIVTEIGTINTKSVQYNETLEKAAELNKKISEGIEYQKYLESDYGQELEATKGTLKALLSEAEERVAQMEAENEELEKQKKLQDKLLAVEQARLGLAEARNKQVRVFRAGRGFVYQADESEVQSAQESLTKALEDLSDYKYELALENAKNFVAELSDTLMTGDITNEWGNMLTDLGEITDDKFGAVIDDMKRKIADFNQWVAKNGGGVAISIVPSGAINAYANGTMYSKGGAALVGENGPELVNLPMGSRVYTAGETSNILSSLASAGNGRTLVFNGDLSFPNVRTENDAEGFINGLLQIGNNGKPQFI